MNTVLLVAARYAAVRSVLGDGTEPADRDKSHIQWHLLTTPGFDVEVYDYDDGAGHDCRPGCPLDPRQPGRFTEWHIRSPNPHAAHGVRRLIEAADWRDLWLVPPTKRGAP